MEAEKEKIGIVEGIDLPAYFEIPVRYQFHENDLVVTVDTKDITAAEGYYLTRVHILKSFLHATENQEGYIFVPDGSGMVIENQKANRSMDKISIPFYGADFAKNYRKDLDIEIDSTFPVFGIRAGDRAVFAIVENGEAMGGVTAQIKSSYLPYNIVYPYLNYVSYDSFNRQGVAYGFSKVIPAAAYSIRYHFLYGQNSTYAGMARYYQTYLEQKGWIRKAEGEANLPIDINLIGTITKTVNKVGFPIEAQYPVTTFENAADIMESLKAGGIDNGDLLYSGMINKGMNFIAPKKVAIQKELGGLEGFKSLYRGLGSMGYELYTDVDFTRIYDKGNGVGGKEDVSKYLSKNTAVIASYYPADNQKDYKTASYLVNPLLYEKIGASFVQSHQKTGHHTLYLSTIGSMLSSNFSEKSELTREEVKQLTVSLLRHLKENGYQMKFDGGNQYVLPFAESLTNVETSSSGRRIESYSVPFVGMVLKGYVPYTAIAVNKSGNYERAVLEAVESGAGLNYLLMYEDQLTLVDTQYKDLFSIHYRLWMDRIIETYQKLNQDLGYLSNKAIINHTKVEEEVFCVTYEEGTEVYVNYSNADFYVGGNQVSAMGYYVQRSKARGRNSDDE